MTATIYECADCGERTEHRRCQDCNLFTRRPGGGGHCPSCDELILVEELTTDDDQMAPSHTKILTGSRTSLRLTGGHESAPLHRPIASARNQTNSRKINKPSGNDQTNSAGGS